MTSLAPAFADPVVSSQAVFRAVMNAMARPGTVLPLPAGLAPPPPLDPGVAAVALTLLDYETPAWLDAPLAAAPAVAQWLRFHTGAPLTPDTARAAFAFVSSPRSLPPLGTFDLGSAEYPDRSTTIVIAADTLEGPGPITLAGPGIDGARAFAPAPLPDDFAARWRANRALFPRGVDLLFVARGKVAGLPRSTRILEEG